MQNISETAAKQIVIAPLSTPYTLTQNAWKAIQEAENLYLPWLVGVIVLYIVFSVVIGKVGFNAV